MISKNDFCRLVIDDFKHKYCKQHNINHPEEITYDMLASMENVLGSTSLGICLRYLGIINQESHPDIYEYLKHRGGIQYTGVLKCPETDGLYVAHLSTEELINLLPDSCTHNYISLPYQKG